MPYTLSIDDEMARDFARDSVEAARKPLTAHQKAAKAERDANLASYVDCLHGVHNYAERTCPKCDKVFCFTCCLDTNVHQGGKYTPDFMTCPGCGHDYYAD